MANVSRLAGAARLARIRRTSTTVIAPAVLETLELRRMLSVSKPTFVLLSGISGAPSGAGRATPNATGGSPSVYTPSLLRTAYGLNSLSFGSTAADGAGQTIAIVDAYNAPTLTSDLKTFDSLYGLSDPALTIESQTGSTTSLPASAPDKGDSWAEETSLDVEWAHAIAPKANILLVEATSDSDANLYAAVDTARKATGVSVVSMSWGGDEASTDSANYNSYFTTPSGHQGVSFVASAGDNGAYSDTSTSSKIVSYPAVSANVIGVGGTALTTDSSGNYVSETTWGSGTTSGTKGGGGGGISRYVAQPTYQKGVVTQSTTYRTVPDISMDASPNTGVNVIDSYDNGNTTPVEIGGTSLAAPLWAGIISLADQDRVLNGSTTMDGPGTTLPRLYSLSTSDFHDVTTGTNGYAASAGYDLATGRGTPIANLLVPDLANVTGTTTPTPTIGSLAVNPTTVVAGSSTSIQLTASNVAETGGTVTAVNFYRGSTLIGVGTQSGTTWTFATSASSLSAGSYTFTAVATDGTTSSSPATTTLTVTASTTTPTGGEVLGWNVTGQKNYGTQGLAATTVASGLTNTLKLTRGSGVSTKGSAVANAWGGSSWAGTSAAGISGGKFITFGATVGASQTLSLSAVDLKYRRSSTGPTSGVWQYELNAGAWTTFATVANQFSSTASAGSAITELNTAGVSGLQGIAAGAAVNVRLIPYGATSTGGTFYVYDKTGDDLTLTGSIASSNVIKPNVFGNWSKIGPAIAVVPESAGQIANTSVVNFGTTVYTGPLNVKNTLDRIRADGTPIDSDDGSVYNNNSGALPTNDGTWYEFVVAPSNGTDHTFTFASPGPMRILLAANGTTYFTGDHYDTFNLVYNPAAAAKPVIGSFTDSPTSVTTGGFTTLTAGGVTETGGTISNVKFYLESNGTSGLQTTGDTLVGTGTASGSTYTIKATAPSAAGTYTYYAVATDASGNVSTTASTTLTVTASGGGGTSGTLLGWDVSGQTNYGTQGLAASTVASGVTNSLGLTRGSGVTTSGSAASAAWGGANWATTSSAGISGNEFITFGLTPSATKAVSLSTVDLYYRRSSSGPDSATWQYELGTGAWTTIGSYSGAFSSTSSSGAAMTELNLADIGALQSVPAGTAVKLRLVPYNSSSTGGTFYVYDHTGTDLTVGGTVSGGNAVVKSSQSPFADVPLTNASLAAIVD